MNKLFSADSSSKTVTYFYEFTQQSLIHLCVKKILVIKNKKSKLSEQKLTKLLVFSWEEFALKFRLSSDLLSDANMTYQMCYYVKH